MAAAVPTVLTSCRPSWTRLITDGSIFKSRSTTGSKCLITVPSGAMISFTKYGRYFLPPLAASLITKAICNGVASVNPWPIEASNVSARYQSSSNTLRLYSGQATLPTASYGKSIPVFSPIPKIRAHFANLSMPKRLPIS